MRQLPVNMTQVLNQLESELISDALAQTNGNKQAAARLLGINRTTLVEKCKRLGFAMKPSNNLPKEPTPVASPYVTVKVEKLPDASCMTCNAWLGNYDTCQNDTCKINTDAYRKQQAINAGVV